MPILKFNAQALQFPGETFDRVNRAHAGFILFNEQAGEFIVYGSTLASAMDQLTEAAKIEASEASLEEVNSPSKYNQTLKKVINSFKPRKVDMRKKGVMEELIALSQGDCLWSSYTRAETVKRIKMERIMAHLPDDAKQTLNAVVNQ